jgi:hypothetical protein
MIPAGPSALGIFESMMGAFGMTFVDVVAEKPVRRKSRHTAEEGSND